MDVVSREGIRAGCHRPRPSIAATSQGESSQLVENIRETSRTRRRSAETHEWPCLCVASLSKELIWST